MNPTTGITKKKAGQQLLNAERDVIISKLIDKLVEGLHTTNALSIELGVSRDTIDKLRPLADELIGKMKLDRNAIRVLQIRRTYNLIETLMADLKGCETIKEKSMIYGQIFKFSSHLALITGLNVETQVNIDHKQLVIIRPAAKPEQRIVIEGTEDLIHLPNITHPDIDAE
jgi:hypothetical protein